MKPPLLWILVFRFAELATYPLELFLTTLRTICSRHRYDASSLAGRAALSIFALIALPIKLLVDCILWPAHRVINKLEDRYPDHLWRRRFVPYMWRWF